MYSPKLDDFLKLASQGNLIPVTRRILADFEPLDPHTRIMMGVLRLATPAEMAALDKLCQAEGVECVVADNWGSGGEGAADLARGFQRIDLRHGDLIGRRYIRLKWLNHLLDDGELDRQLRWRDGHAAATAASVPALHTCGAIP